VKRLGQIAGLLLLLLGVVLLGASFFYRVVRTPWGTVLLEKPQPSFGDSYVDTRLWNANDFMKHWELSKQLMQRGLQDLPRHQPPAPRKAKP
jgi:hypothetical protein